MFATLSLPVLSAQEHQVITETSAPASEPLSLMQRGIEHYEAGRFLEAIDHWQQALAPLTAQNDRLNQAFVFSNLSLAYQQLEQWQEAEVAVHQSLDLLQSIANPTAPYAGVLAKALNTQGRWQWFQGQTEAALATWQQATLAYYQAEDEMGILISLVNQAQALQTLGFSTQAEAQLEAIAQRLQQQADPALKVAGLRSLGSAFKQLGQLSEAKAALQESLIVIENANLTTDMKAMTLLELGNIERAFGNKAIAIGNSDEAEQYFQTAISNYQQTAAIATAPMLKLQAQLNQLSLLVETAHYAATIALVPPLQSQLSNLPASRTSIYAQLNFAKSLLQLSNQNPSAASQTQIAALLAAAVQQAQELGDPVAESYALGQLGELYEAKGQWVEAQTLTQQAWLRAEEMQAPGVRYRWEWQLARLRQQQGDKQGAIAAYQAAVESLQSVRTDLLRTSADVQFSFRDDVEPIYRGLVELLVAVEGQSQPSQDNLKQAIRRVDSLQLAELENFLRCDLAAIVTLSDVQVDPTAAKIYPIILENRLAIVLELPGDEPLQYHEVLQSRQKTEQILQQLRTDLREPDRTPEAIAGLQEVYRWLIQPFTSTLQAHTPLQTLVFVLDGELRNIPMAALYDGENYLINRYAVAVAPSLELFQPRPRSTNLQVFLGGVGEPQTVNQRSFDKIENLTPELNAIQQLVDANPPLLNESFTPVNIENYLKSGNFSAIHLKTHGVFSSDPEATFIVAYQDLITSRELGHLIQTSRIGAASAIELLVLSACSTAQGDDRAVLGLAGIAIQAGAQSAVSTLWEAQDLPNTALMIQFYQALLDPTLTKAQALRSAQLHLIERGYRTPHIWATYVLVGNWL
ncbi:MAG: hypothetical protein Kow00121_21840 [Elainellaceae cyanobacterium]